MDDDDVILTANPTNRLLSPPSKAHAADHHHISTEPDRLHRRISQDGYVHTWRDVSPGLNNKKPETGLFGGHKEPVRGRKWDHARDGDPVIMRVSDPQQSSWGAFIRSSMYGPPDSRDSKVVSEDFLRQQTPGYEKPWRGDLEENQDPDSTIYNLLHGEKKRRSTLIRIQVQCHLHQPMPYQLTRVGYLNQAPPCTSNIPCHGIDNVGNCTWVINFTSSSFQ